MTELILLIGASLRSQLRWARQHIYSWLILAPLVLGITYATASRLAGNISIRPPGAALSIALATILVISLIGLSLSRASAELYHLRRPEHYFEALPISATTYFSAALATRLFRTMIVGLVILLARSFVESERPVDFRAMLATTSFTILVAMAELFAALNWIHWSHKREKLVATGATLVLTIAALTAGALMAAIVQADLLSARNLSWLAAGGAAWAIAIYALAYLFHNCWRASDIEYARRLEGASRPDLSRLLAVGRFGIGRLAPVVGAQLARDLRLTVRAFSSAVYVVLGVSLMWLGVLFVVLVTGVALSTYLLPPDPDTSGLFNATWLPAVMTVKLICAALASTLIALLPVLVAYELPHLWLERATGTTGLEIWQAKLFYTRVVSLPAPLASWLVGMLSGGPPLFYALPLLGECLWLWWMVSSLAGSLSFEMPERPGLSIIVMVTIGLGAGLLTSMLWPIGIIIYFQAMHGLTDRGRERVRYYLMTEGD